MDLNELGWMGLDWIHLAQENDNGFCEIGDEYSGSIKGGIFLNQISDYQMRIHDSIPQYGIHFIEANKRTKSYSTEDQIVKK
jgi:hypothetical protein